jgi:hypothetical protein
MASNLNKMESYIIRAQSNLECIKTCLDMLFGSTQDCSMVGVVAPHFFKHYRSVLLSSMERTHQGEPEGAVKNNKGIVGMEKGKLVCFTKLHSMHVVTDGLINAMSTLY